MTNLIAYIPVPNNRYLEWLEKHQPFNLFLIAARTAESLLPRLERNVGALSELTVKPMIHSLGMGGTVRIISPIQIPKIAREFVMPDEDLSHLIAEKYLYPADCKVEFEPIWGRWDMTLVKREEPIVPDLEASNEQIDSIRMDMAKKLAPRSPDWWRQIAAFAFRGNRQITCSYNAHHPSEYETVIFGDPRLNFNAGDSAGAEVYLSLHAEKGIVGICARDGVALKGASVYVTTFPCGDCARMLATCQIKELFFSEGYSVLKGLETLQAAGVRIVKVKSPESA